jgi:hypothetical protein
VSETRECPIEVRLSTSGLPSKPLCTVWPDGLNHLMQIVEAFGVFDGDAVVTGKAEGRFRACDDTAYFEIVLTPDT